MSYAAYSDGVDVYWTIPTQGDPSPRGRRGFTASSAALNAHVTDPRPGRFADFDHLVQVARAAEQSGFDALLVPYDPHGEESWIVATALAREVPRIRLTPELQPGFATAVYTAKMALSFQRYFDDRLEWKLALDAPAIVQRSVGDFVEGERRIARAEELLAVIDGVWHDSDFTHLGEYFEVEGGGLYDPVAPAGGFDRRIGRRAAPRVVLDGTSPGVLDLSARRADLHVFDLDDAHELQRLIGLHRNLVGEHGRTVRYGLRLAVIARQDTEEAWREARRLWRRETPDGDDEFDDLRVEPLTWRGFDRFGLSVTSGLIGSFEEIADHLRAIARLGVSTFVLDGVDHLAEARRLGEFVLPLVRREPATV